MKILFVRHGETEDNLKGFDSPCLSHADLTENGKSQVRQIAQTLKQYSPQKIYYSPTARTTQTAQIIANELSISTEKDDRLTERNWGDWGEEGLTWRELTTSKLNDLTPQDRYELLPPNGESWKDMENRLLQCVDDLKENHEENIIVITHTGCLRALLPALIKESIDKHQEYSVKTGSVTIFCTQKEEYDLFGFRAEDV